MTQTDPARIMVIGGGGREHALCWALARSPSVERVFVAPGNAGTALEDRVENVRIGSADVDGLVAFYKQRRVDLTVIGPEKPLAQGLVDSLRAAGLNVFGPTRAAARLETSKGWAREFMHRNGIPHPRFVICETADEAEAMAAEMGDSCVIKADGLAAGKGVYICADATEARTAIHEIMVDRRFGDSGARVLVEERLNGPELSVMAICDGRSFRLLPSAQDHKRLLDGDHGPNTGGMGAYAPAPFASPNVIDDVRRNIIEPVLTGMAEEGSPFSGCLFCGLMNTPDGLKVIEFNVRFGDPETQVQLPLLRSDLSSLLMAAAEGRLDEAPFVLDTERSAVCVVLASRGYPGPGKSGFVVHGLDRAAAREGLKIFHAGTTALEDGEIVTAGGRALGIVCVRPSLGSAVTGAYSVIGQGGVHFEGMSYRTDIAFRALSG